MVTLTAEQKFAWEKIIEGHGTVKTFFLRQVVSDLKLSDLPYALLCTTGMGSVQYFDLGVTTVHRYTSSKAQRLAPVTQSLCVCVFLTAYLEADWVKCFTRTRVGVTR